MPEPTATDPREPTATDTCISSSIELYKHLMKTGARQAGVIGLYIRPTTTAIGGIFRAPPQLILGYEFPNIKSERLVEKCLMQLTVDKIGYLNSALEKTLNAALLVEAGGLKGEKVFHRFYKPDDLDGLRESIVYLLLLK